MVCKESKEAKSIKTNKQANKQTISTVDHWYMVLLMMQHVGGARDRTWVAYHE